MPKDQKQMNKQNPETNKQTNKQTKNTTKFKGATVYLGNFRLSDDDEKGKEKCLE